MNRNVDYYQVLGIDKNASLPEIKQAYRKLAMLYHPDRNPDNPQAMEKFKAITEAYQVLDDPNLRDEYDSGKKCALTDHPRAFVKKWWEILFSKMLEKNQEGGN